MISWIQNENTDRYDIFGLSTDSKPTTLGDSRETPVQNGTMFFEIDTATLYIFDIENSEWIQLSSSGNIGTGGIDDSDELREAVDDVIADIIEQYGLNIEIATGTWEATLNNLAAVCASLYASGVHPSGSTTFTDNGTFDVTNLAEAVVNVPKRTEEDTLWASVIPYCIVRPADDWFRGRIELQKWTGELPPLDVSGVPSCRDAFSRGLMTKVDINIGNDCLNVSGMFMSCAYLTSVKITGETKNIVSFGNMFNSTPNLTEIDCEFDFTSATDLGNIFTGTGQYTDNLKTVRVKPNTLFITVDWHYLRGLSKESILSLINSCADMTSASSKPKITMNQDIDDTDTEIFSAISGAVSKGWIVSFFNRNEYGA